MSSIGERNCGPDEHWVDTYRRRDGHVVYGHCSKNPRHHKDHETPHDRMEHRRDAAIAREHLEMRERL